TFFLEGFGESLWGSNVKVLDIGIPDAPLNVSKIALASPVIAAVFAVAVAASLAIVLAWRARDIRRETDEGRGRAFIGPGGLVIVVLGLAFFLARFVFGPEAAFIQGKASKTAAFLATLSWTGLAMALVVALFSLATWYGQRQAAHDAGRLVAPLHFAWF